MLERRVVLPALSRPRRRMEYSGSRQSFIGITVIDSKVMWKYRPSLDVAQR